MSSAVLVRRETARISPSVPDASSTRLPRTTARYPLNGKSPARVLFVTSEMSDLVKVGGLGDVSAALPRALRPQVDARVLIPGYTEVVCGPYSMRIVGEVAGYAALPPAKIGRIDLPDGLIVYVVVCPALYQRPGSPYGDKQGRDWPDNPIRFARLAMAAADIAAGTAGILWRADLLHSQDWPTGLTSAYLRWRGISVPSVFTIHNLGYLGLCEVSAGAELGLPGEAYGIDGLEFYGQLSLLKAGISYADRVTTVSKTYAKEITTQEFGCGLDGLLRLKLEQGLLSGIPNGIDEGWDPRHDPHLIAPFALHQWRGRELNAAYIRSFLALDMDQAPLFAVVSRLVYQKGLDLTLQIADALVAEGAQLAIIGQGEPGVEQAVRELALRHPGRVGVYIGYDEANARRLYAGSDFLLMPSRYEPGGLSQMYAQRYGSLPIARRTGGLADTIEDGVTGFLFAEATASDYLQAVQHALSVFRHPELLYAMRCRAMLAPYFWRQTVQPYLELYQGLLSSKQVQAQLTP